MRSNKCRCLPMCDIMIMSKGLRSFYLHNRMPLFTVRPDSFDKNRQNVEGGILFSGEGMICGIYKIENIVTGDIYIGQSIDLRKRKNGHFCRLKNNNHRNSHLQRAYHKYGAENFEFRIVLYCEPFELTRYEQALVDKLIPYYNIQKECVSSHRGVKLSEEHKKILLEANKGKHCSEEKRRKLSDANKGKTHIDTDETKRKISAALKGKPKSDRHKQSMSIARKEYFRRKTRFQQPNLFEVNP